MNKPAQKIEWLVWGGLVLIIGVIGMAFAWSRLYPAGLPLPVLGQLPNFNLTNQNSEAITLASLRGQVWVADVIFSRCPSQCMKMTRKLAELQAALPPNEPVRLVSLTSDPDYDTPAVLKRYAGNAGANPDHWWFLTGKKSEIMNLEVKDFKFSVLEKAPDQREVPDDLFIHSTFFMLVDRSGQVRGWTDRQGQTHYYFDSEDPDAQAQILAATNQLLREPAAKP